MTRRAPDAALDDAEAFALLDTVTAPRSDATGLLLAVSGGPDSMALLHLAARWQDAASQDCPPLFAATVDHGLRQGSAEEAETVGRWCISRGVPHAVLRWTGPKPATGIQDAAREARYALLVTHAKAVGASHLATAHHADDQAETVLMRLTRGSGLKGLAGMANSRMRDGVRHVRPFLGVSKSRLVKTIEAAGQPSFDDPSNANPRFGRVRLRMAMSALAAEGLTPGRLNELARRAARADAALDAAARDAFSRLAKPSMAGDGLLLAPAVFDTPEEIVLRVLLLALEGQAPVRLERVERLAAALIAAKRSGMPLRRSIAGSVVSLDSLGQVTIKGEKVRRRGAALRRDPSSSSEKVDVG